MTVYCGGCKRPLPRRNVVCIDPHNATGLVNSLSSEYRLYTAFPYADLSGADLYEHPQAVRSADGRGTGIFIAGGGNEVVFATLTGTTRQVAATIVRLIEDHVYRVSDMIVLYEKPHPSNAVLCQTAGYLVGYLSALYYNEPVGLPPRANDRRHINAFLRYAGLDYEPTPHEVDAFMLYHTVYAPSWDIDETVVEDLQQMFVYALNLPDLKPSSDAVLDGANEKQLRVWNEILKGKTPKAKDKSGGRGLKLR